MKERNYHRILLQCALLLVVFICSAQAITTEELMFAENAQSSEPIPSVVAAGAMNQEPDARPGRSANSRLDNHLDGQCL
jgi:signal recognition particle receptor subunit beta